MNMFYLFIFLNSFQKLAIHNLYYNNLEIRLDELKQFSLFALSHCLLHLLFDLLFHALILYLFLLLNLVT